MKKLFLIASVLVASIMSANTVSLNDDKGNIEVKSNRISDSKPQKKAIFLVKERQTYFAETSCGVVATTTQDWTPQQASEWRDKIEENYCKPATHYGPSTNLAGN